MGITFSRAVTAAFAASVALVVAHGVSSSGLASAARWDPGQDDTAASVMLQPGQRIQRELSANGAHTYRVSLIADRYVELRVEQLGIELSVRVANPDRRELLATSNPTGPRETRTLSFVTTASGDFDVRIAPAAQHAATGEYV